MDIAILKQPWMFDNQLLVLNKWKPGAQRDDVSFSKAPMWVRIEGIPHHWQTNEVGWKVGQIFFECWNVVMSDNKSKEGRW